MVHELVIVLDFGGLYNQLIARRVRENKVYCEVMPFDTPLDEIKAKNPKGIIFTGGPNVVTEKDAPNVPKELFELGIPILGICYGCQVIGYDFGAEVVDCSGKEYGKTNVTLDNNSLIFKDLPATTDVIMSHTYSVKQAPVGFKVVAHSDHCAVAAMENAEKKIYGVQFHPEVSHTDIGIEIIKNFLYNVCLVKGDWIMKDFSVQMIQSLKEQIGDRKVLCALSGGVDSSVSAVMVHRAIGQNLTCIFVDHGLMRLDEGDQVMEEYKKFGMNVIRVNAQDRFLGKLAGVTDPETKRKIIGEEFIRVFEEESRKIGSVDFLVQGTIYPDIIESGTKHSAVIKSHHNVGGLPDVVDFKGIIEPLRDLFKDEVREVGLALGIDEDLVYRQPFPGPGLAVRVIGDITKEKLDILRQTDFVFRDEIKNAGLHRKIWQYFTVLTGLKSVGVMGDERTYCYTVALRAVNSVDAMTAEWYRIPFDVLEKISTRMVQEVPYVNRVVYDITSKPPATIEWE